uniref:Cytochrome c oxidase subunit 2 n=1 Tax=Clavelina oblonga TaxID=286222 RepID=A0A024FSF8_9ASCI|nr:cytochrome c oxidase subunit II [Clavelina oblonga]CAL24379.1 cytochrome c oxidase subunit II [Clavelina oblonga]
MTTYSRLQFLDGANITSSGMIIFHDFTFSILMFILTFVIFMTFSSVSMYKHTNFFKEYNFNMLETIWTIFPALVLLALGVPSFLMMYFLEGELKGDLTVKAVGHQWFWSYEGDDLIKFDFDSYMVKDDSLNLGDSRVLEVDNSLVLPLMTKIRMIITSTDVLHSWAMPSMCLKMDAIPGRLNTMNIMSSYPGSFYGQCSEICGINHSFMPIHVEFIGWKDYIKMLMLG